MKNNLSSDNLFLLKHKLNSRNNNQNIIETITIYPKKKKNNEKNNSLLYQCQTHYNEKYQSYCATCNIDLCQFCEKSHLNHRILSYEMFSPNEEEMNSLINTFNKYNEDYKKLLYEIFQWKKEIDKIIEYFDEQLKKSQSIENYLHLLFKSFQQKNKNFSSLMKFRKVFELMMGPEKLRGGNSRNFDSLREEVDKDFGLDYNDINNNIGLFSYKKYTMLRFVLDNIIKYQNVDFVNKSERLIKLLWDCFISGENNNDSYYKQKYFMNFSDKDIIYPNKNTIKNINISSNNNINHNKFLYEKNNMNSLSTGSLLSKTNNNILNDNNDNSPSIIEKYIDLNTYKKNKRNSYTNKNPNNNINNNNSLLFPPKVGNIFIEQNKYKPLLTFPNENINNNTKYNINEISPLRNTASPLIYKKSIINNKKHSVENPILKRLHSNQNFNIKKNRNYRNIFDTDCTDIDKEKEKGNDFFQRQNSFNEGKNKNINSSNNISKKDDFNKYIPEIKVHNRIYNNNKYFNKNNIINKNIRSNNNNNHLDSKGKKYVHKKFESSIKTNNIQNKSRKELLNLPYSNKNSDNNNNEILSSLILNNSFNHSYSRQYLIQKKLFPNFIPSTNIFETKKKYFSSSKINNNNNQKINSKIKISKKPFDYKYQIDQNEPLCIGVSLGNSYCQIGLLNQNENNFDINLFCIKENIDKIPTIVYFNEKNEEIKIGYEAIEQQEKNPSNTIFNLIDLIGKNSNEIPKSQKIWPFKIYNNSKTSRPYIKITYNNSKDKIFFFESLLAHFLKKLFEKFFDQIEFKLINLTKNNIIKDKDNCNILQVNLVISVPSYLSYFQRRIIEKIIEMKIFPNENESINSFDNNKQDKQDKQDNISCTSSKKSTSLSTSSCQSKNKKKILYGEGYQILIKELKIENDTSMASLCLCIDKKINNCLIINIEGSSTNICVASIKNNNCDIKTLDFLEVGEGGLIDNYIEKKLRKIFDDDNNKSESFEDVFELIRIRKKVYELFTNNSEDEEENTEILDIKLPDKEEYKMEININDYEYHCLDYYNKIIYLIQKVIKKANLTENDIDYIFINSSITKVKTLKLMIKDFFKNNIKISNQFSLNCDDNTKNYDDFIIAGTVMQSLNISKKNSSLLLYHFSDITSNSFGIETLDGLIEFVIKKGEKIPIKKKKFIKIKKNNNDSNDNKGNIIKKSIEINIYEGENKIAKKNRLISCANIDKKNFKNEKICNNYIELLIEFEINNYNQLRVFVLDSKSLKRRFECIINMELIEG